MMFTRIDLRVSRLFRAESTGRMQNSMDVPTHIFQIPVTAAFYMQMVMEMNVRHTVHQMLAQLLERVLDIADFFVYRKNVTLSELVLFSWTLSRAVWFSVFGVSGGVFDLVFNGTAWISIFWLLAIFKVAGVFLLDNRFRRWGVIASAILWGSLTILAIISGSTQPVAISYGIFFMLAVVIAIRLKNDTGPNVT
jgi:hypothetical protein